MTMTTSLKRKLYFIVARYFRFWASISLRRWKPRIIVVTGSVGKTTMLHLIEQQLGDKAHYSHNANSAYGISFDIVGTRGITSTKLRWLWLFVSIPARSLIFRHKEEFYIVEADGERPHEAEFLAEWLKPEVTVWVSSAHSHAMYFDRLVASGKFKTVEDAIAHEFSMFAHHTSQLVLTDGNNERMRVETKNVSAKVVPTMLNSLKSYSVWPERTSFRLENGSFTFDTPLPREIGLQLMMLEQLLIYLNFPINWKLDHFEQAPGRSSSFEGINGTRLIDSTYNAHLASMSSIIDMLSAMQTAQKWIVVGDMVEQGKSEAAQHTELGHILANTNFERYILVGRRLEAYTLPVIGSSSLQSRVVHFDKVPDALAYIKTNIQGGETIAFKGSQYLEWVVEKLLANPSDAEKLARQEPAARKRRASWGLT